MENSKIVIRAALENDYAEVARLNTQLQRLHAQARPDLYRMPEEALPADSYTDWIGDAERFLWVAEITAESNVVPGSFPELSAYLLYHFEKKPGNCALQSRHVLFVDDLVVDERLRRSGIGTDLIRLLQQRAREASVDTIELNVAGFNGKAADFYETLGFSVQASRLEFGMAQKGL
ncbi:GNAT family N-acetyltransferase [Saccharibacillus sacchari]|uniref:GNAT family N-acetyltransferase n=1 Tax=Saccharibacillus sacchari TaxID=456493 RepID=A0ACC6PEW0_9BACL